MAEAKPLDQAEMALSSSATNSIKVGIEDGRVSVSDRGSFVRKIKDAVKLKIIPQDEGAIMTAEITGRKSKK